MKEFLYVAVFVVAIVAVIGVVAYVGDRQEKERAADLQKRVEGEGCEAGRQGVPVEACPYPESVWGDSGKANESWKKGWQKGYLERQEAERQKRAP